MDINGDNFTIVDLVIVIKRNLRLLVLMPLIAALASFGLSFFITPKYTAKAILLPPQQQGNVAAAAALQSLGALAGLASSGTRSSIDQYVALMQSARVSDRIIDAHKLKEVYGSTTKQDARDTLAANVKIMAGKKDGLIVVEFDDENPQRAAMVANSYINELRRLTTELAVTEAQQRRVFFETQLQNTRNKLTEAQEALQASGIDEGTLRAEPRSAAEAYASLKAQMTSVEIKIQAMRNYMTEASPEVRQAQANLSAIRAELKKIENSDAGENKNNYIGKYREFKYQEALFELFARQFESAKIDESREGALVQAVDFATAPERKSRPRRALIAGAAFFISLIAISIFVFLRENWRNVISGNKYSGSI